MDLREFFQAVVTSPVPSSTSFDSHHMGSVQGELTTSNGASPSEAWFSLALGPMRGPGWSEKWFRWPEQLEEILDAALTYAEDANVYFSSYLFKEPTSTKDNVLATRTIQADLDGADTLTLPLAPSILVETSDGRHQGYWFLRNTLSLEAHEALSRKLTYSITGCDTSGWPLGRKVRVPYTFNYKYLEGPQQVKIVGESLKVYDEGDLELLADPPAFLVTNNDVCFLDAVADGGGLSLDVGPQELLAKLGDKIPPSIRSIYNTRQKDRSRALWALLCAAFRAGCSREQAWWLGWHSANNKFSDLKYHGERELAKDVLRAETSVRSKIPDERAVIGDIRRLPGAAYERRQHLLNVILDFMKASGEFIHTVDDLSWYVRADLGRPILISPHSEWLDMLLDLQFGLNGTEQDKAYVSIGLSNYCRGLPVNGLQQSLSYYDSHTHSLLLHTGRKEVIRITSNAISRASDGAYGVVFPWGVSSEPFSPVLTRSSSGGGPEAEWADILFRSALDNATGLEPEEALSLLRVWFLFLLFRSAAVSRPILAFFGQPGAGKSTLFRRIYTLLYGRYRSLIGVTSPDNFDQAVASEPFVVLDNVDRPEPWLPDRLAQSASTSDIPKRKLYTDGDQYVLKRQALLGVTAHNPRFNREDVADRLLLITFSRLQKFLPEGDIISNIQDQRNRLWGGIVLDCQKVLQTSIPSYANAPQFRVEDFARIGYWISSALGCSESFSTALQTVGKGQKSLNLEEDSMLVVALQQLVRIYTNKGKGQQDTYQSAGSLWNDLTTFAAPDVNAFKRIYRNPVFLGKKLWSLQDSLKEVLDISWKYNSIKGAREWRVRTVSAGGGAVVNNNGVIKVHGGDP